MNLENNPGARKGKKVSPAAGQFPANRLERVPRVPKPVRSIRCPRAVSGGTIPV